MQAKRRLLLGLGTLTGLGALALGNVSTAAAAVRAAPAPNSAPVSALPQADQRVETPVNDPNNPADVEETFVKLHYPLPASAGPRPAECDWVGYMRFRLKDGPRDSKDADGVVTSMPGFGGGAGELSMHAAQTVHSAAAKGKKIEFWALERRSACLEDHTGLDAANQAKNADVALGYYFGGKEVNGHRFGGFKTDKDVAFLAHVGLAQTLDDWRVSIQQALPDPASHKKVFCGGHSLGGPITGLMSSWDFDGDPKTTDDAGYNLCGGGYVAIDTGIIADPIGLTAFPIIKDVINKVGGATLDGVNKVIAAGPRTLQFLQFYSPKILTSVGIIGQEARYRGDQESTLLKRMPNAPILDIVLRLAYSRTWTQLLTGMPSVRDYRFTGQALFGSFVDDNSMPLNILQVSQGALDGGPVAPKTFPLPGQDLGKIPFFGEILNDTIGLTNTWAPTSTKTLYHWRQYDRIAGSDAARYTSPDREVTDLRTLAVTASSPGPSDLTEWYFPTRLITDIGFALVGTRTGDLAHLMYDGPSKRPQVGALGGDSPFQYVAKTGLFFPKDSIVAPNYSHIDMTIASPKQNNGKPEPVTEKVAGFVVKQLG
ncbi:hypothetical protein J4573_32390 [Actinomadura barringtoniae]|uniref:Uncharacterized protein n=1 Tax=Actinomadura barringtoniae TaxID=1427535 RepID=A0A939TD12_9ACTN|nr:hypothetical protein [Actinomadura barringtoniae]MBO2451825.1 hypothetical protein [Actinomadura barringtoniae]